jgi:hypothetical protein
MKTKFKKNNFIIIKKAITSDLTNFIYNYFLIKRQVAQTLFQTRYISPFSDEWGVWNADQVPNTYSHYADIVMETLLLAVKPKMEEATGLKLNPTYSYARIYKKGDILHRHKDRFSCEISTTMNLGGDEWPIYLEAKKNVGTPDDGFPAQTNNKGTKVILKPGDMLVYKGMILEHWRDPFDGENCAQVFLHYNNAKSKNAKENMFDTRPHLGLPSHFRGKKLQN